MRKSIVLNAGAQTIGVASSNTLTVNCAISGDGGLVKQSPGTLLLNSVANSYAGDTQVVNGTLQLGVAGALPATTGMEVNASGTFDLAGFNSTVSYLDGNGNVLMGAGTLAINGSSIKTFSGSVSGSGGIGRDGAGVQTLDGTLSYTGNTLVTGGTLILVGANTFNSLTGTSTASTGGTLRLDGVTFNLTTGKLIANSASVIEYIGAAVNGGSMRGGGTHRIPGGAPSSTFTNVIVSFGANVDQAGPASFDGVVSLGKIDNGTTLDWTGGGNSGTLNVNATVNTSGDWLNSGTANVHAAGKISNMGRT